MSETVARFSRAEGTSLTSPVRLESAIQSVEDHRSARQSPIQNMPLPGVDELLQGGRFLIPRTWDSGVESLVTEDAASALLQFRADELPHNTSQPPIAQNKASVDILAAVSHHIQETEVNSAPSSLDQDQWVTLPNGEQVSCAFCPSNNDHCIHILADAPTSPSLDQRTETAHLQAWFETFGNMDSILDGDCTEDIGF